MSEQTVYDDLGNVVYTVPESSDSSPSVLSVDYYRQKVIEFQNVLNNLDGTLTQLINAQSLAYDVGDEQMIADVNSLLDQCTSKLSSFRVVAEGIQLASKGINAVGIDFPSVQLPAGLGILPAIPLATAAAVITAAVALIVWANGFWQAVSDFAKRYQTVQAIQNLPPDQQAAALTQLQQMDAQVAQARASSNSSPLAALSDIGKWIVLGGLLFVGYKALANSRD